MDDQHKDLLENASAGCVSTFVGRDRSYRSGPESLHHISSIERGRRQPSLDYVLRLGDALGAPMQALVDGPVNFTPPKMKS